MDGSNAYKSETDVNWEPFVQRCETNGKFNAIDDC